MTVITKDRNIISSRRTVDRRQVAPANIQIDLAPTSPSAASISAPRLREGDADRKQGRARRRLLHRLRLPDHRHHGPELAFGEIRASGQGLHPIRLPHRPPRGGRAFEEFCEPAMPIIIGAAQGASCFSPAYGSCH